MIPGVQKPHWLAPVAQKAAAHRPASGSPSTVVMARPATRRAGVTHATRGCPSTRTVQQPHCPWGLHPSFGDVAPTWSRRTSSSDERSSGTSTLRPSTTSTRREVLSCGTRANVPSAPVPGFSRRSFLLGSGAAALLAACGGDDDGEAAPSTTTGASTTAGEIDAPVLGVAFDRNNLLVTGVAQRAPFLLFDPSGGLLPIDTAPEELTIEFTPASGGAASTVSVARHGVDIERAYWPVTTTFTATGIHTARTEVGGVPLDPSAVAVPQVGAAMPSAPTPTTADPLGVATMCTDDPACPLHETSLDAALAAGRPVALLVSTPAFCQVAICGPVLDLLLAAAPAHPGVAAIHLEVYPGGQPDAASLSPVVTETLGLAYEPALFVVDAGGRITARLDNIYDGAELDAALAAVSA
jgi:hypothetical protein